MGPILYLSGYMNGTLVPGPKPLGAGAATPVHVHKRGRRVPSKLPQLPCALERHGLDPKVVAQEDEEDSSDAPPPAGYANALERMRAKGIVT